MRSDIAESILQTTMDHWDITKRVDETRNIQFISEIKYDDYQQYTHGMRYVESLALWLRQFNSHEDRDIAYDLAKNKLIYISEEEMRQLISCSFPIIMRRYLLEKAKWFCDTNTINDTKDRKDIYRFFKRCSLFLGLSDGAHMDFFRRQNKELSNEQVFLHYDYSNRKAEDMKDELGKDAFINIMIDKYPNSLEKKFCSYFLIDDFTGSGKSYIRNESGSWHGKIHKFFSRVKEIEGSISCDVHIIIYIATQKALDTIKEQVDAYARENDMANITVDAMQIIHGIEWTNNAELHDLLERSYNQYILAGYKSFEDVHYKKGAGAEPYLGFADCSLPLVLYHNTPNNSLPIIWYTWNDEVDALFPRITRHKEL